MGLLSKLKSLFGGPRAIPLDVEARFERQRSAVSGTMSNFFAARDRQTNRIVGLKICDIEKVQFFESRFKGMKKPSEGEIASSLHHPHVVETMECGITTKGAPYLIMEYVDGPGLQQVIQNREEEQLKPHRLELIRQMAEALKYVHSQGYIHRDICPRNFLLYADYTQAKLIDFGLTVPATKEFMQPGNRTGTPLYMAPEIVRRKATDQRVDIFSFGVTCYQFLTYELPWPGDDTSGLAALHHDTQAADILGYRPELNKSLANLIMQCLRANPADRIQTMEIFLSLLRPIKSEVA